MSQQTKIPGDRDDFYGYEYLGLDHNDAVDRWEIEQIRLKKFQTEQRLKRERQEQRRVWWRSWIPRSLAH